jgi:hypothetical protein
VAGKNALTAADEFISVTEKNALTAADETAVLAPFTGADKQLWKIDQLADGSYRIASKAGKLALTATGKTKSGSGVTLKAFTGDDAQRWDIIAP